MSQSPTSAVAGTSPPNPRTWVTVLAIGGAAAYLLCGYELIRSVSSSLFIGAYGAKHLPVVMFLGPVGTIVMVYLYGRLLSRFGARGAMLITSVFSTAMIAGCWFALRRGVNLATGVLYVFREAYIVVLIEQYWSFINSTFRTQQARRVNGPITGLGSVGSMVGAGLVASYAQRLGSETLLLFAAASLVPAGLLACAAYMVAGEPQPSEQEAGGKQGHLALRLFGRSPRLVNLALLIAATQVISTVLDLRFSGLVEHALPVKDARTAFFGHFYYWVAMVAFVLQFVVTPILLRLMPLRIIHPAIPLIHLLAAAALLVHPCLATGAAALLIFKVIDYSVFRAAKEILYIPLTFDERYRAKSVIDAFGYRFAKGGVAGLLALATKLAGRLPGATYALVALGTAVLWLPLVLRLTQPETKPTMRGDTT